MGGTTFRQSYYPGVTSLIYRPDIDGIRAIAIISVVIFHAFPGFIRGGFIGVDIFFVISGFLISTILFKGFESRSFSVPAFYARRIRRIFPALLVVLVACAVFGWFGLLDDEYKQLGKHIAGAAGFVLNVLLRNEGGYFDNAVDTKPLLHLWSLGIEEQFYIVWPLLLWVAWKYRLNWFAITLAATGISLYLNVQGTKVDASTAFYSLTTRFWELSVGSLLSYIALYKQDAALFIKSQLDHVIKSIVFFRVAEINENALRNAMSLLGAFLLLLGLIFITKEVSYPGTWALLPTLGTALVLAAGSQAWFNHVVLSNRVAVWFGMISFPLYLWHWPLLVFVRIATEATTIVEVAPQVRIGVIMLSIGLAWFTCRFIERPIRFGSGGEVKTAILVVSMIVVCCAGLGVYQKNGFEYRYAVGENDLKMRIEYFHSNGDIPHAGVVNCSNLVDMVRDSVCSRVLNPNLAIIGDSHAHALYGGFVKVENKDFRPMLIASASCYPTMGIESRVGCAKILKISLDQLKENSKITTVMLVGFSNVINDVRPGVRERYFSGYVDVIDELTRLNKKIIFVIDNPTLMRNPGLCINSGLPFRNAVKHFLGGAAQWDAPAFCLNPVIKNQDAYLEFVGKLKNARQHVFFYNPRKLFCDRDRCDIFKNGKLLYVEEHHLSIYGAEMVAHDLIVELKRVNWQFQKIKPHEDDVQLGD